jgi:phosphoribosylanthranilate isomerase
MIQVKVCGVTRVDEALVMESWGVRMLGFNFVEGSKRYISPVEAAELVGELAPSTMACGVFMNQSQAEIASIVQEVGLDAVQFHGQESPELLQSFAGKYRIKVFAVDASFDPNSVLPYQDCCEAFLFDTQVGGQSGGTGAVFSWDLLAGLAKQKTWFLAGGLGPENVESAAAVPGVDWLDLNSKIERLPGSKDLGLLNSCLSRLKLS